MGEAVEGIGGGEGCVCVCRCEVRLPLLPPLLTRAAVRRGQKPSLPFAIVTSVATGTPVHEALETTAVGVGGEWAFPCCLLPLGRPRGMEAEVPSRKQCRSTHCPLPLGKLVAPPTWSPGWTTSVTKCLVHGPPLPCLLTSCSSPPLLEARSLLPTSAADEKQAFQPR